MIRLLFFTGFICLTTISYGQTFRNVRVLKEEGKIIILYDLIAEQGSKVFVSVQSSIDNFQTSLTNITGDAGIVLPGGNRRIEWKDPKALQFAGDITVEFKGEMIQGLKITKPSDGKLRRGKRYEIKWRGGIPEDTITLKFIMPNQSITIGTTKNTGSVAWLVPKNLKTGKGYLIRITDGHEVYEQQVVIARKIPLVIWAVPVVGAAVILGLSGGGDSSDNDLPNAPKPN